MKEKDGEGGKSQNDEQESEMGMKRRENDSSEREAFIDNQHVTESR